MKYVGRVFLLKVEQDGEYVTVGCQLQTGFAIKDELIDVSDKESAWRQLLEGGQLSITSTSRGHISSGTAFETLAGLARDGTVGNFQLCYQDGSIITRAFQVAQMDMDGAYDAAQEYSITMESSGSSIVSFSATSYTATEGNNVVLTIERAGSTLGEAAVDYSIAGVIAIAGTDYTDQSGTVTFAAGESSKQITVATLATDLEAEMLADAPWALWKFDEASGTTAVDVSGNGRDLTVTSGTVSWGQSALNGSGDTSVRMDSTDRFGRANALNGDVDLTAEMFFLWEGATTSGRRLFRIGGDQSSETSANNVQFRASIAATTGALSIFWERGAGVNESFAPGPGATIGASHYMVFGRDVSEQEVFVRLDAGDVATLPYTNGPDGGSSGSIMVGSELGDPAPADGRYSYIAVYDKVIQPNRYNRWRTGAQRTFTVTLANAEGASLGSRRTATGIITR